MVLVQSLPGLFIVAYVTTLVVQARRLGIRRGLLPARLRDQPMTRAHMIVLVALAYSWVAVLVIGIAGLGAVTALGIPITTWAPWAGHLAGVAGALCPVLTSIPVARDTMPVVLRVLWVLGTAALLYICARDYTLKLLAAGVV